MFLLLSPCETGPGDQCTKKTRPRMALFSEGASLLECRLFFLSLSWIDFTFCPFARASRERTEAGGAPRRPGDSLGASLGRAGAGIITAYFFSALAFNAVVPGHSLERIKHQVCSEFGEISCSNCLHRGQIILLSIHQNIYRCLSAILQDGFCRFYFSIGKWALC